MSRNSHIYVITIVKFSNRSIQNLFNCDKWTCMDSCKLYKKLSECEWRFTPIPSNAFDDAKESISIFKYFISEVLTL